MCIRDKKGDLLIGWKEQASRWREHFPKMLNREILKEEESKELNVTHK